MTWLGPVVGGGGCTCSSPVPAVVLLGCFLEPVVDLAWADFLCSIVGCCGSSISGLSYLVYLLTPADCGGSAIYV
jgi:hypothetical protein